MHLLILHLNDLLFAEENQTEQPIVGEIEHNDSFEMVHMHQA